jgi:hypothetical protein
MRFLQKTIVKAETHFSEESEQQRLIIAKDEQALSSLQASPPERRSDLPLSAPSRRTLRSRVPFGCFARVSHTVLLVSSGRVALWPGVLLFPPLVSSGRVALWPGVLLFPPALCIFVRAIMSHRHIRCVVLP